MSEFARPSESSSCNFAKSAQNEFAKSLAKNYFYSPLSYSPTFIIGLMSTGRLISGRALVHSWPSKEARLRDRFCVADDPEIQ
jgi:hypothetical protein